MKFMEENIERELIKFGLSKAEAAVYYSSLALEEPSADNIARYAKINRTTCYPILERLKDLGLVSQAKKKGKTIFKASSPDKILDMIEDRKQGIEKIIPDLKSLFEVNRGKPEIKFYQGKEGLKTVLNLILKEAGEVLIFGDGDSFRRSIPGWTDYYSDKREGRKIRSKIILKATPTVIGYIKGLRKSFAQQNKLTEIRLLPEAYVIDYSGFDVFENKVVFYSFEKENIAVIIESGVISRMMRSVFSMLWNEAEKYNRTLLRE